MTCSDDRLDTLRAQNPDLGFALYALIPGGIVTLEIVTPDGEIFTFKALTAAEALSMAFPEQPVTAAPEPSVFD